jgi:dephospho-CoA kinase
MRELIFSNTSARGALEQILHPLIRNRAISTLTEGDSDTPYFLLVVPLLFESAAFRNLVDRTLVIDIPEDVQVARVQARSGLDPATIHAIMCTQLPRSARNALADDRLSNTLPQEELRKAVKQLHQRYLALRAN